MIHVRTKGGKIVTVAWIIFFGLVISPFSVAINEYVFKNYPLIFGGMSTVYIYYFAVMYVSTIFWVWSALKADVYKTPILTDEYLHEYFQNSN